MSFCPLKKGHPFSFVRFLSQIIRADHSLTFPSRGYCSEGVLCRRRRLKNSRTSGEGVPAGGHPKKIITYDKHPPHRSWRFLPVRGFLPEIIIQKDYHLRPRRLRRTSASRRASSSGQHSLPGVGLPVATPSSDEHPAHRSWRFPPVRGFPPEENIQKDHHLRPPRLRRTSASHHASSSGEHSLPRVDLHGTTTSSDEHPPHRS